MIEKIAYDKATPRCAWCGGSVTSNASRATLCGMICHNQTASGGNRRDCLHEHTRECETCLSVSSRLPGVGTVTPLFWECRCQEEYIHPYHLPQCPACNSSRDPGMPARVWEVLIMAHEWHLEDDLVARLREAFPDPWDPALQPDAWLGGIIETEAVSEERARGLAEPFKVSHP